MRMPFGACTRMEPGLTAVGRPQQNVRAARLSRKQATSAERDWVRANEFAATTAPSPPSRTPSSALPHLLGFRACVRFIPAARKRMDLLQLGSLTTAHLA